jgi:hypothetical protein
VRVAPNGHSDLMTSSGGTQFAVEATGLTKRFGATVLALAAAAAALVLLTTACGAGSTDEGQVAAVAGDYLTSLADGDYNAACAQLAPEAKPADGCPAGVEASVADVPAGRISEDNDGKISVDVDGNAATVTLESGTTLELTQVAGTWLVSSPYAS